MAQEYDTPRRFKRIPFSAAIRFVQGEKALESTLIDISLKGVLAQKPREWQGARGDHRILELLLDGDVSIKMDAVVAHVSETRVGFEWKDIELEGFTHLRRLLSLNVGSEELLKRELSALVDQDAATADV